MSECRLAPDRQCRTMKRHIWNLPERELKLANSHVLSLSLARWRYSPHLTTKETEDQSGQRDFSGATQPGTSKAWIQILF